MLHSKALPTGTLRWHVPGGPPIAQSQCISEGTFVEAKPTLCQWQHTQPLGCSLLTIVGHCSLHFYRQLCPNSLCIFLLLFATLALILLLMTFCSIATYIYIWLLVVVVVVACCCCIWYQLALMLALPFAPCIVTLAPYTCGVFLHFNWYNCSTCTGGGCHHLQLPLVVLFI